MPRPVISQILHTPLLEDKNDICFPLVFWDITSQLGYSQETDTAKSGCIILPII